MKQLKIVRMIVLVIASTLLSACGLPYPVDANAPEAKIGTNDYLLFQNNNLSVLFADYKNCKSGAAAIIPFTAAMPINVKNPATIFVNHTVGYSNFRFTATFQPRANHTYLIDTRSSKISMTTLRVALRILDNTNGNQPILFAERKNNISMLAADFCSGDDYSNAMQHKVTKSEKSGFIVPIYLLTENLEANRPPN